MDQRGNPVPVHSRAGGQAGRVWAHLLHALKVGVRYGWVGGGCGGRLKRREASTHHQCRQGRRCPLAPVGKPASSCLAPAHTSRWHLVDAVVVISSLVLELSLHNLAQEVASLLVFFRLWRILRVMHGVAEAIELNHESELSHHHRLVHGLQQVHGKTGNWAADGRLRGCGRGVLRGVVDAARQPRVLTLHTCMHACVHKAALTSPCLLTFPLLLRTSLTSSGTCRCCSGSFSPSA